MMKNLVTKYFFLCVVILVGASFFYIWNLNSRLDLQRVNLQNDLNYRTNNLADNVLENISDKSFAINNIGQTLDRISTYEKIVDVSFYDKNGLLLIYKNNQKNEIKNAGAPDISGLITKKVETNIETLPEFTRYLYTVKNLDETKGYIVISQDQRYINENLRNSFVNGLVNFYIIMFLLFTFIFLFIYLLILRPTNNAIEILRKIRKSVDDHIDLPASFLSFSKELKKEVHLTIKSFLSARQTARDEASLRQIIVDSPWTEARLEQFFIQRMKDRDVVVVSNREPYVHFSENKKIKVGMPAHGLITALDSIMKACKGTWIAHGSGEKDADFVDENNKIRVPVDKPEYSLKRVWLTEEEIKGFYVGFSNETMFPLCVMTHNRPIFRDSDWEIYKKVNEKFANSVLEEIKDKVRPIVFIQDLHFSLLPEYIKKQRPDAEVITFWHHPWPAAEIFSICPWKREILRGLLASDLMCFHIPHFGNNFIETVKRELEIRFNNENNEIYLQGNKTLIRSFPISIPFINQNKKNRPEVDISKMLKHNFNDKRIILGVDRLDYSKGLIERLRGVESFYDLYPEYRKKTIFVQVAAPSREQVKKYREYAKETIDEVERINNKLQTSSWKPILFIHKQLTHAELVPIYSKADVCLITSLHDGMNLVAKEYVAEQEKDGVLILSEFTGAAREMTSALLVNPYSPREIADSIKKALEMSSEEKQARLEIMRNKISQYNVYRWAADVFNTVLNKF
ncbi:MAG: trehalose-6-phosphate synthase [Minisyncoccia bacterium]